MSTVFRTPTAHSSERSNVVCGFALHASQGFECGLLENRSGKGCDAFRQNLDGSISAVEIKATISPGGFNDIKRDLRFDELYWLDFSSYDTLKYRIYRFTQSDVRLATETSRTARERATLNFRRFILDLNMTPLHAGRIGVINES